MENDPARRYQKASEVKTQVETIAGTPAPASPAAPVLEQNSIRWAGFPVVVERDGARRVNRKEMFKAFGILFGVLTIIFGLVSLVTGRTWFGWLGISGHLSLQLACSSRRWSPRSECGVRCARSRRRRDPCRRRRRAQSFCRRKSSRAKPWSERAGRLCLSSQRCCISWWWT